MQELLRLPRAPWLFGLLAIGGVGLFVLAIAVVMAEPAALIGERPAAMTCLQVAFTPARITGIILAFPEAIRQPIADMLVPGDMVLAFGYGFLLAGLTGLLAMRLPGNWLRIGALIMWTPLLAATLDCIEDIFLRSAIMQIIQDPAAELPVAVPLLASIAATIKYLCIAVITPLYCFAGVVKGFQVDRSISAVLLYILIIIVMISFVLQPAQQIPPCFINQ
jgi:hypothetical protein